MFPAASYYKGCAPLPVFFRFEYTEPIKYQNFPTFPNPSTGIVLRSSKYLGFLKLFRSHRPKHRPIDPRRKKKGGGEGRLQEKPMPS